jgi:NADPH:quinone reductase-like Zn-dependent oxidoreductase
MKTVFRHHYGPVSTIEIRDVAIPTPKPGEILVKVKATTVNRTDQGVLLGKPFIFRFFVGFPKPRLSATGTDFSGTVVKVGDQVKSFKSGDDVYGFWDQNIGTHAEYVCINEDMPILLKPQAISFEQAAASLEGAHYAYYFLKRANVKRGDNVLVIGATGAIGNAAVQMLIDQGVHVTFTYPTDSYEKIKHLKAARMIDYLKEDFLSGDTQFDFVFDAVGKSSFGACKKIMKPGAIYVSSELGPRAENIPLALIGLCHSGKRVVFPLPGNPKSSMPFVKALIEKGAFTPLIDRIYNLDEIREAFSYMLTGEKRGNVVIRI